MYIVGGKPHDERPTALFRPQEQRTVEDLCFPLALHRG